MDERLRAKVAEMLGDAAGAAEALHQAGELTDDREFVADLVEKGRELQGLLDSMTGGTPSFVAEIMRDRMMASPCIVPLSTFLRMVRLLERVRFND